MTSDRLQLSDHLLEVLGLTRETYFPSIDTIATMIHPDDAADYRQQVETSLASGIPYRFRYRVRHADGHYIPLLSQGTAVYDADGIAIEMIGIITDLSEEVEASEKLANRQQTFQALSDNVPGALFQYHVTPHGVSYIEHMSSGSKDIWEFTPEEIEKNPSLIWELVIDDDLADLQQSGLLSAEKMQYWTHSWRIRTPSGKIKPLEGRAMPRYLEDGSIVWYVMVVDVSEEQALREEILKHQEILAQVQKMDAIGRIAGGIAHDFNNLLAIVLGNAQLLELQDVDPEDAQCLDAIVTACIRGGELTRRLLSFARKSRLEPEFLNANEVVAQLNILISRIIPESILIETKTQPGLWQSYADKNFLENSLLNLCINARDAMVEGGRLTIETRNVHLAENDPVVISEGISGGDYVVITVSDTGVGIPPQNIVKVIEPFFSTKGPDMGTGLGLAMVHGFARQSAGMLLIDSVMGQGTKISIFLPSSGEPAEGGNSLQERKDGAQMEGSGTVLVVEDEPGILSMLEKMLTSAGFKALLCPTADAAYEKFGQDADEIDVMLSDVVMPGKLQGMTLAAKMTETYPNLRVVFMSGYANDIDLNGQTLTNVVGHLMKPVSRAMLVDILNKAVAEARTSKI
ncbi:hybrid sensor histidine kinase/response regulator [Puniceibacterium sediminis]|uniref:hybrid sensor histidine kinase/response regulator n=1 Tax=Puniceibacterium sediminis TaxID=1608407 RepID=UPI0015954E2F|nr:PAS domain-containing hybrid sensor histidine kinase/response regulator [Puniceibacterium sediminis]